MVSSRTSKQSKYLKGCFYYDRILHRPADYTNVEHWNQVLNTCLDFKSARSWVSYMYRQHIVTPNLHTFNKLLQRAENVNQAQGVLQEMRDRNIGEDAWTTNIIINKWTKNFASAYALFSTMHCKPNLVTFQVLSDRAETVQDMYLIMTQMDAANYEYNYRIWHNLLRVADRKTEAERFYNIMQRCGVQPSAKTHAIMRKWRSN